MEDRDIRKEEFYGMKRSLPGDESYRTSRKSVLTEDQLNELQYEHDVLQPTQNALFDEMNEEES